MQEEDEGNQLTKVNGKLPLKWGVSTEVSSVKSQVSLKSFEASLKSLPICKC